MYDEYYGGNWGRDVRIEANFNSIPIDELSLPTLMA